MQRSTTRLLLAVALFVCAAARSAASEDLSASASSDPVVQPGLVIRAQSPSTAVAPPQLRVAQDYMQPAPYYPADSAACPPPVVVGAPQFDPYAAAGPRSCCPWDGQCAGAFGEFLYLRPRNNDVPFAVPQSPVFPFVPTGPVGVTDPGFSTGFRAGAFVGLGSESRLVGTYSWYKNSTSAEVDAPAPNTIHPLVLLPGTFPPAIGFAAHQATADQAVRFQQIDLDYEVAAQCCPQYWWGYLAGARYAKLDQSFDATFPFVGPGPGITTTLNAPVSFKGVGPTAGLQGERSLFPNFGLRAYGKGTATFLVGRFQDTFAQANSAGLLPAASTSLNVERIVPVLDFELGLAWVSPEQHVRISAGYLISAWFNTITTPAWIQSVQRADFLPGSNTLTFDGLVARAEVRF